MQTESEHVERKRSLDMDQRGDRLSLVREIVAMANTSGGQIVIGEDDDGAVVGVLGAQAAKLDPARLTDLLDSFTSPEHVEVTTRVELCTADRYVVRIGVPQHPEPPVVLARDGNYESAGRKQTAVFRAGDVLVRNGTKAERAKRADYQRWLRRAADSARALLVDRVALIANLPDDATLQIVTDDDSMDEPSALLSRSVRTWRRDPAKLLSTTELALLLLSVESLSLDEESSALILHSALRKRSTLWHWLTTIEPDVEDLGRILLEAVHGRDRDKSDAGRSIVEVAAVTLDEPTYQELITELAASSYAHFRDAADDGTEASAVRTRLVYTRSQLVGGVDLRELGTAELWSESKDLARTLMHGGRHASESRRLGRIGLEVFSRSPLGQLLENPAQITDAPNLS